MWSGLVTVGIVYVCLVGDRLLATWAKNPISRVIVDTSTHGLVALLSWAQVVLSSKKYPIWSGRFEILLCGFLGSAIDLDHFAASRSFDLKSALSLDKRPVLHSTGLCLLLQLFFFLVSLCGSIGWLLRFGWIFCVAFVSHHVRDATRRGIWLWGSLSTAPIPYYAYLAILAALPLLIARLIDATDQYLVPSPQYSQLPLHSSSHVSQV